ncbi:amidohydrolase family protein [Streptomyces marincola]|uniref:Amidohydrolase n=1 Tax=Streptomyces marincola TaxID=2878388 RepID=A0A1W7CXD1_9ACTN|nr:amidohydrolase family protein [Streptomyces marincola]ARQ69329.1 amidohydrolase [Streptomyces marincola]
MDPLPLVDQHCHGVLRDGPHDRAGFEALLTESHAPPAPGTSFFDTQLGFAVRRWCAPVLGLEPHCAPEAYLDRRSALGTPEVTRRLLRAARVRTFLVDTGLPGDLLAPEELAAAGGGTAREIVRLEPLAERAAAGARGADAFLAALGAAIGTAAGTAAAFKSVAAYRYGLDLDPRPPAPAELWTAATRWLASGRTGRLTDPVLLRHLMWSAARTGLPLQVHTGFGDPDLRLHRADPLLLTDFLRAVEPTGCRVVLLHGYPFHRNAGYLAAVHPHVYADVGLTLGHTGARAEAVLSEMLELAPFGKLLFSTDAHGLPELYLTGAQLFRQAMARLSTRFTGDGSWSRADADRVAALLAAGNARRLYGLDD